MTELDCVGNQTFAHAINWRTSVMRWRPSPGGEVWRSALASLLYLSSAFYRVLGNTHDEAMKRVMFMKSVIEDKGGHRYFYVAGEPLPREEDLQTMYRLTWFATPFDVSRKVNDGRGPADFKISRGGQPSRILVEHLP